MLETLSDTIAASTASVYIADHLWVTPMVQSLHIMAIAALSGSVLMVGARLARLAGTDMPIQAIEARYAGVVWWSALVLLVTGVVLVIGEPARELLNVLFRLKMLLVLALLALMAVFQWGARQGTDLWSHGYGRALGIGMAAVWLAIVSAGRWIAYI
jgi:hypothetical protein